VKQYAAAVADQLMSNVSSTSNMHVGDGASGVKHGTPRASEDGLEMALSNAEAWFNQPDSVLEKPEEVLEALKEYLKAGGKIPTAVNHLSNTYMGKDSSTRRAGRCSTHAAPCTMVQLCHRSSRCSTDALSQRHVADLNHPSLPRSNALLSGLASNLRPLHDSSLRTALFGFAVCWPQVMQPWLISWWSGQTL
jgi:hypothetical protein